MTTPYENTFGRRPGRGIRPWLLVPKLLAVTIYFGGLVTTLFLWATSSAISLELIAHTSRMFIFLIVPALLVAIGLGIALAMQNGAVLLKRRWLRAKLIILAIMIPTAHLYLSNKLASVRDDPQHPRSGFIAGLLLTIAASAIVIILARLKPRLRQNPAEV